MPRDTPPSDPALFAQRPQPTQAALDPYAIEWMFTCIAHDLEFFTDVRALLQEQYFLPHEEPMKLLWRCLCRIIPDYGAVTFDNLRLTYDSLLRNNPNHMIPPNVVDILFHPSPDGLLYALANPPAGSINPANVAMARQLFKTFAYERSIVNPMRRMLSQGLVGHVPSDLGDFLQVVGQQQLRITTVDTLPMYPVVPDFTKPMKPAFEYRLSGVSYIDEMIGGHRVGDCNGIIGPTGGGKTTTGIHITVQTARQCWDSFTKGGRKEAVVYATCEEHPSKLLPRLWSAAFQIERKTLESMTDFSQLSTREKLKPYEYRLAGEENVRDGEILSESERFLMGSSWFKEHVFLLDLSGSEENPSAGYGMADEVSSYLSRIQDQYEVDFRAIVFDYAGLSVDRYMQANGQGENDRLYRRLLKTVGDSFRRKVSEKFGTTSWLLHMMKGEAGSAKARRIPSHTDAAECKDFADNMAFCGCLGTMDRASGCRAFNWSKTRACAGEKIPLAFLKVNEQFAMMDDVTSQYMLDAAGRLVTRSAAAQFHGVTPAGEEETATISETSPNTALPAPAERIVSNRPTRTPNVDTPDYLNTNPDDI